MEFGADRIAQAGGLLVAVRVGGQAGGGLQRVQVAGVIGQVRLGPGDCAPVQKQPAAGLRADQAVAADIGTQAGEQLFEASPVAGDHLGRVGGAGMMRIEVQKFDP